MKLVIALVVVVLVGAGIVLLFSKSKPTPSSSQNKTSSSSTSGSSTVATSATITYDGSQFEPNTITIKAGQAVKIVNQSSSAQLSFDSDPHPTHTNEPELNAGDIDPGVSTQITVTKPGNWGYHNHFHPDQSGTIIVTAN